MSHALIVDFGATANSALRDARDALEDRGWETLLLRRAPPRSAHAMPDLLARWSDCDLALLVDAPDAVVESLQRHCRRPAIRFTSARRRGDARLVG